MTAPAGGDRRAGGTPMWRVGFLTDVARWFDRVALGSRCFAFDVHSS